jgi:hypothetical protein
LSDPEIPWSQYDKAFKRIHDAIRSGLVSPPDGKAVTKIEFGEDADGNIREIKFYDGTELLFTLTFSNAGPVVSTWNITRS